MAKKKEYLVVDQVVYKEQGWSKQEINEFMDEFIELVENFKGQASGSFIPLTEEKIDEMYTDE
jgi:hypothetical protein